MADEGLSREVLVRAAAESWVNRLVSLDGHNRMLFFRDLVRGTLELSREVETVNEQVLNRLLERETVRLSELVAGAVIDDAARSVRSIAAKARSNFEEKGLLTLYLGCSFATWNEPDGRSPRAPVVMIPTRVHPLGAAGRDAELEVSGPPEVNVAFRNAIERFGFDPYPEAVDTLDSAHWLAYVRRSCAKVPGFSLDDGIFLTNFEFSKLPTVVDIEDHFEMLVTNDVVAAIAGDDTAKAELTSGFAIDIDLPDRIHPQEEFLVCDADASQNYAVVAAQLGRSLVVHGPPGTGKSQTIANLIASMAARGKSVLFVAEKRAAIEAVTRRLDEAGCGDLVLDLHNGFRRRDVAASLGTSIDSLAHRLAHHTVGPHEDLASSRAKLVAHRRKMHQPRDPHGLSFFELQAMLGTPDAETTGLRLSFDALHKWTEEGRKNVLSLFAQWRGHVERLDDDPTGSWSTAKIGSMEEAEAASDCTEELVVSLIPALEEEYRKSLAELSPGSQSEVTLFRLAEFVVTTSRLADKYEPSFFEGAPSLAEALQPIERSGFGRLLAQLFDGEYRNALRTVQSLEPAESDPVAVLSDARKAAAVRNMWAAWVPDRPMPLRLESGPDLMAALSAYESARDSLAERIPALADVEGFGEQISAIGALHVHRHLAKARAELKEAADSIGEYGLGRLLGMSVPGDRRSTDLAGLAMRVFAASAIDAITWQEPELAMFDGRRHQETAERYVVLDSRHLASTAQRVMREVASRAVAAMELEPQEAGFVRHEAGLKGHHMPVRRLIARAPNVVKALRPCWAMSPQLVARTLPATPGLFDVIVFDEASQVSLDEAIPAIARGNQLIVVGDPHQLAPNRAAAAQVTSEGGDGAEGGDVTGSESILDVMRRVLVEQKLQWHYRSHDERLINFSNIHTYDRSLVSFPGTNLGTGIRHDLVEGLPESADDTASNPAVAARVVELILEHVAENPGESLGVIATSNRHAEAIAEALRIVRGDTDHDHGGFFEDKGSEPFFIKTMDRAQGDERDHVIFSVGFGRNQKGEMVYRWGALTRTGGERLLNVAITRAKRRMTVVASIESSDVDPTRTRSRGAALLAQYLEYAERGGEIMSGRIGPAPLTPFAKSVHQRLTKAGIPLQPHYGVGELRLDFAAFVDDSMTRPVLAIETDGVAYNASATARDRDRLRPEVLTKRGWSFHRIWSVDWYRDPEGETARAVAAWERAVREARDMEGFEHRETARRPVLEGRGRSPIAIRRAGILAYSRAELVQLIQWIESDEVSRTDDELVAEATDVLGLRDSEGRVGRALRAAIKEARGETT